MRCPACYSKMLRKYSIYGPFWGCSAYPNCTETTNIDENDDDYTFGCERCGCIEELSDQGLCSYCQHMWDKD